MSGLSSMSFHVLHENMFTFLFECVHRRMMKFRMDTVKLNWDAFESISDFHKIPLQRLGLPIRLFYLILSTWPALNLILILHLYNHVSLNPYSANVLFLEPWKLNDFLKFSGGKNRKLIRCGSRTHLMFLKAHSKVWDNFW